MTSKTIPQSILTLLAERWPAEKDGRRLGPVRYLFRPDDSPGGVNGGLKYSQVRGLVADSVLTNDWRGLGDAIVVWAAEHQARTDMAGTTELRRVG